MRIAVVGSGYVGLVAGACFADLGHKVIVVDNDQAKLAALKAGEVDMSFTNATPARMKDMSFSSAVVDVEQGYLVPPRSRLSRVEDIDAPGIRVGVSEGSTSEATLPRLFKSASIVRTPTLKAAIDMLAAGRLDAFATNKAILYEMSDSLPGSTVLAGRWGLEHFAIAVPKGREAALGYVDAFVADDKSDGTVARAVERAQLRGTVKSTPP